jgi:predicted signal transduction protein with EAL and GGDEF domain
MAERSGNALLMFPPQVFQMLLDHEVSKSRRYGDSLTLVELLFEVDPAHPESRSAAERFVVEVLTHHLREADVPCALEDRFRILMPATSAPGARTACERLRHFFQPESGAPAALVVFMGMASMPTDHSITSAELLQHVAQALNHARANQISGAVAFTEIK